MNDVERVQEAARQRAEKLAEQGRAEHAEAIRRAIERSKENS